MPAHHSLLSQSIHTRRNKQLMQMRSMELVQEQQAIIVKKRQSLQYQTIFFRPRTMEGLRLHWRKRNSMARPKIKGLSTPVWPTLTRGPAPTLFRLETFIIIEASRVHWLRWIFTRNYNQMIWGFFVFCWGWGGVAKIKWRCRFVVAVAQELEVIY